MWFGDTTRFPNAVNIHLSQEILGSSGFSIILFLCNTRLVVCYYYFYKCRKTQRQFPPVRFEPATITLPTEPRINLGSGPSKFSKCVCINELCMGCHGFNGRQAPFMKNVLYLRFSNIMQLKIAYIC